MPTATATGECKDQAIREDSPSSESLSSESSTPSPPLLPTDAEIDNEVASFFRSQHKLFGDTNDFSDYPRTESIISEFNEDVRADSVASVASGYNTDCEPQPLAPQTSHSRCTRKKALEYSMSFLVVGLRMAGKVLMTYYGAKVFIHHSSFVQSLAVLAWATQNIIPAITGVQNYFMGGSSGHKTVKNLMRTPRLEFQALIKALFNNKVVSGLVMLRLVGDAIYRGSSMQHVLSDHLTPTAAWVMAITISGLNALCDIKFTAASDYRLLKRLQSWLCCHGEQRLDIPMAQRNKIFDLLRDEVNAISLHAALVDLDDCAKIRRYVRTAAFQQAYFIDTPHPNHQQKWQFTRIKEELIVRASRYSWRVELASRLTSIAVNFPFLYLTFNKNQGLVNQFAIYQVAMTWGVIASTLKMVNTQGKTVEGLSDTYAGLGRKTYGRVKRTAYQKPHALFFCCFDILPFSIFGAGQILDMPHKLAWLGDGGAKVLLGIFAVTQLLSYCCFVAPRVTKRMPSCFWARNKDKPGYDYAHLDDLSADTCDAPVTV
ncbi:MAG: hypothetical protein P1U63_04635 [Coxiellaceae bacterium]|nr:hypothetical protein [Coxiellaceae bacterium]